ncbi:MAG: repeat protein [Gemmatimonadetes bacterium]|nr:repeat protein [Gemmatimonadota bacterium]
MSIPQSSQIHEIGNRVRAWSARTSLNVWQGAALIGCLHVAVALLAYDPTPQAGGDNAAYRALAEALATGRGYVRLWEPAHPMETLYPPVFPLILAAAYRLGEQSFAALQLLMVALSTAGVVAMYCWLRRTLSPVGALVCGLIIALSPGVLDLSHAILSDIPFAALSALALWAFASAEPGTDLPAGWKNGRLVIGILATIAAYFTRSAGLPLLLAALIWLAWKGRYAALGGLLLLVAPLALAWSARARHAGGANYADYLRYVDPYQPALGRADGVALISRVFENAANYGSQHLPVLLFGTHDGFAVLGGWLVLVLAALGFRMRLGRLSVAELWIPMYVGILLLWPQAWSGERLLLPIFPLILAYAALAFPFVRLHVADRWIGVVLIIGVIAALVNDGERISRGLACTAAYRRGEPNPCVENGWKDYFAVARSLHERLPAGAVVMSRKPTILYAESGYPSMVFPLSTAPDTLLSEARKIGAQYLLVDASALTQRYVYEVLREHPSRFCSVPDHRQNLALLLRIEPENPAVSPDTGTIVDCKPANRP